MAKKGLRAWGNERWVDIANPRSDGSFPPCGRSKGEKRSKYPKCVPSAKASKMSSSQKRSAVKRKQSKDNSSKGKPGYAKT